MVLRLVQIPGKTHRDEQVGHVIEGAKRSQRL
jgi:hypothetical protein